MTLREHKYSLAPHSTPKYNNIEKCFRHEIISRNNIIALYKIHFKSCSYRAITMIYFFLHLESWWVDAKFLHKSVRNGSIKRKHSFKTKIYDRVRLFSNSFFSVKCFNGFVLRIRCEIANTSEASSATHLYSMIMYRLLQIRIVFASNIKSEFMKSSKNLTPDLTTEQIFVESKSSNEHIVNELTV